MRSISIVLNEFISNKIKSVLCGLWRKVASFSSLNHVLIPMFFDHGEQVGFVHFGSRYQFPYQNMESVASELVNPI